jgi:hypothetical protein
MNYSAATFALSISAKIRLNSSCADFFCCLSQDSLEGDKGSLTTYSDGFPLSEAGDSVSKGFLPEVINFFS